MDEIAVDAVIVPPFKPGEGYGHTRDGRCIAFTGERERMVALCRAVLQHVTEGCPAPRIRIHDGFQAIDTGFCPLAHEPQSMAS